ncbi:MAG: hypothetical protein RL186_500, partial [Pseudomonadota bacterium]
MLETDDDFSFDPDSDPDTWASGPNARAKPSRWKTFWAIGITLCALMVIVAPIVWLGRS